MFVAVAGVVPSGWAQEESPSEPLETIEVIGQTPLGATIDADRIAANVQQITSDMLDEQHLLDLSQFMQRNLASVFVNEAQGNPLQPDIQYRGFVGSPLLGLPQGLAVYQDGVRLNEPFGDTINWALLPQSAVQTAYLMPGSNPLFGLNAIGGSVSLHTKDGFSSPGARVEVTGGSFDRVDLQASLGGTASARLGYFVTAEYLEEDGWRDFSPTESGQLFGKLSWRGGRTGVDLGISLAQTDLIGNGAAPVELLAIDRSAIFTRPDITENELGLVNLRFDYELSDRFSLTGNLYLRGSDIVSLNGDDSDFEECEDDPGFICDGDDELIFDQAGSRIPVSEDLAGAAINRTNTRQDAAGFALQSSWRASLGGRENLLALGLVYDDGSVDFDSSTELGALDATRLAVPGGVFVGDAFTRLHVDSRNLGLFWSDVVALSDDLSLTISGRYNRAQVSLRDGLGTALDGNHRFERFNPAVGLTAAISDRLTVYAGYSEASRAPSPVELTCADEDDPCRLPNAFLADPPLEQVVAKTLEAGLRGRVDSLDWHAGWFRTTSHDDILFISAGALSNEGFFDNVGRTRRDGIEINLSLGEDRFGWFANYTYLDASFREDLILPSPNNPASFRGEIFVRSGDRLPLVPRHLLKMGFDWSLTQRLTLGADLFMSSEFHLRGDEANNIDATGRATLAGLTADFRANERLTVFLRVDNALDREYETFGVFGEPDEVLGADFQDPRFLTPAAPRALWIGVRFETTQ